MSTRLKVTINCVDCDAERMITKACLELVKRCKPCQKIFNRDKARNRYRALKGIPLDKPIVKLIKKKEKAPAPSPIPMAAAKEEPKVTKPTLTPEEDERRQKALAKLFDMIGDDSTVDDW